MVLAGAELGALAGLAFDAIRKEEVVLYQAP